MFLSVSTWDETILELDILLVGYFVLIKPTLWSFTVSDMFHSLLSVFKTIKRTETMKAFLSVFSVSWFQGWQRRWRLGWCWCSFWVWGWRWRWHWWELRNVNSFTRSKTKTKQIVCVCVCVCVLTTSRTLLSGFVSFFGSHSLKIFWSIILELFIMTNTTRLPLLQTGLQYWFSW